MELKQYFQAHSDYFWYWEDDAGVIAIPEGSTIAYRQFIIEVLELLAPHGLPPFGALLLAIIATNPDGAASLDTVVALLTRRIEELEGAVLADAMQMLKLLCEVPAGYKQGKKRILLLQAIFERSHKLRSAKNSINLYQDFLSCKTDADLFTPKAVFAPNRFLTDFRPLALLKNRFPNVDAILNKIASLPAIPGDVILLPPEQIHASGEKDLIDQLIENQKSFYVGSLIRRLWSGLNIPVHSAQPSVQPLGGISDLTNKGDFDKLLISEFANDDIVFLSRLANNEALYLHREIPPAKNDLQRILLIDVSLKNWGTPKTIAFATMLAIARHPKTNISCTAFAVGNTFTPISIRSADTIIDGLQLLEGSINCTRGLAAFFKENPSLANSEVFFITEASTFRQHEMLRAIHEYAAIKYWIQTDAAGNIDIFRKQQKSKKHIQHIQLPLAELWKKERKDLPVRTEEITSQFPILFRSPIKHKKILTTSNGAVFQVTGDGVLLKLYGRPVDNKGWELLVQQIPFTSCDFEIGLLNNGDCMLLIYHFVSKEITLLNVTTGGRKTVLFEHWKPSSYIGFLFHDQKFYHHNNYNCWSIDTDGNIEKAQAPAQDIFISRQRELKSTADNHASGKDVFRNINEIFINQKGNLVFNVHELILQGGEHSKLEKTSSFQRAIGSTKNNDKFWFADGSAIELVRAGAIILKSSDKSIPCIYLSSVVKAALGMSAEGNFAGNEYYNKSQETMNIKTFYQNYITRFIRNIQEMSKP